MPQAKGTRSWLQFINAVNWLNEARQALVRTLKKPAIQMFFLPQPLRKVANGGILIVENRSRI
jgi:hypothetical protein